MLLLLSAYVTAQEGYTDGYEGYGDHGSELEAGQVQPVNYGGYSRRSAEAVAGHGHRHHYRPKKRQRKHHHHHIFIASSVPGLPSNSFTYF